MRKQTKWIIVSAMIISLVLLFAMNIDRVNVNASTVALEENGWSAVFSKPLKKSAIKDGKVYVIDQRGEKISADIRLSMSGKQVVVSNLEPGSYALFVDHSAVSGGFLQSMTTSRIEFSVYQELPTVKSTSEIREYFVRIKKILKRNNSASGGIVYESGDSTSSNESASAEKGDYSTTNNQVDGVDEGDIVKTDGNVLYSLEENRVHISDITNPTAMKKLHTIKMDQYTYPSHLFLEGQTLIILANKSTWMNNEEEGAARKENPMIMPMRSATTAMIYDVSTPSNPNLVREFSTEGYLQGARLADNTFYFITSVTPNFWAMEDDTELRPMTTDSKLGSNPSPMETNDLSILPGSIEPSYTVITSFDLTKPVENVVETKGYLGGSQSLYMSKQNLYLTASIYEDTASTQGGPAIEIWNPSESDTEIFKFTLDGSAVKFMASARVDGMLLNQFSMDEYNDHFRVVTTEGFAWNEEKPSKNNLFILDGGLKQVGSIEGLADGERIYSARFMGDKAYMVTFKQTDPLFVFDVSNPVAPKVLGELKIPGFSNYIHPLDDTHLIGFGFETEMVDTDWSDEPMLMTGGMKISLFDVTDLENPKEQDTEIIGGPGTYSQLQHDHKALFQHQERGLYGFPVSLYEGEMGGNSTFKGEGALVYQIDVSSGITKKADLIRPLNNGQQYEDWQKSVQRMIYSKDTLYTVSMSEVKSYDLDTFQPISQLNLK
ncbi:beta-propeller domain-containing protein [Paenisporosarcina cavernae]|uniref:Uncharacterized protein n=1 Tax=Paenisporosarcina cavernae TaxID=2320858 RepID=A0A385YPY9_9BACL|nr:beta-propeller domain-containing protein [Paenisporosarcina cavernae]AYC28676.1 hypothetical protein D3873_01860 [Paenisporosarcina cavernae]